MQSFWTPEKEDKVRVLWAEGFTSREIAAGLGCTRCAVIGKVHRLGLPVRVQSVTNRSKKYKPPKPLPAPVPVIAIAKINIPIGTKHGLSYGAEAMMKLEAGDCRWPIGDPLSDKFGFCSEKKTVSHPYCAYHNTVAFVPLMPRIR